MSELNILLIEDRSTDAELCAHELRRSGLQFKLQQVCTRAAFEQALSEFAPDIILSDFSMPTDLDGFSALGIARDKAPDTPFVFVSGTIGEERAVEAMKAGATDYVLKDKLQRLGPVVKRAVQEAQDRRSAARAQDELRESNARFRSFMRHLPGRAAIRDRAGRYTYVNEAWEEAFPLKAGDVAGQAYDQVWGAEHSTELKQDHDKVLESNQPVRRVFRRGQGDDATWWLAHQFPLEGADGRPATVGTIAIDVTEQKLQEEKITRLSRIHAVLSGINSAIVRIRDTGTLLSEVCRIAVEQGGFGSAWIGTLDSNTGEVTPVAAAGLEPGEDIKNSRLMVNGKPHPTGVITRMSENARPAICNDMTADSEHAGEQRQEAIRRGYRSMIALPLCVGGRLIGTFCLYAREPNSFDKDELKLLSQLAVDVSFALEYIDKEQKLQYLAWHDPVTGLANRSRLHDRLHYAVQTAKRNGASLGVLVWDIKRFRTINDTFGRAAGDELLRQLSARIARLWPHVQHTARLSADYFGGFVEGITQASDIAHWLEQSAAHLDEPFVVEGSELVIGLTVGIALHPGDGGDAETLLANAEAALKQAKAHGERYMFYESGMNARVAEKLTLESKLRRALDKDQFVLHYQPKIDMATGTVKGLEALIRWNDPQTGLVPPMQFIPLLEETGLILDVGRWAICKALEDRSSRTARGLPTPRVAVNVSAIQLRRRDFVDVVEKALGESHGEAHGLDLEITESLLMENIESNMSKLRALKDLGVDIAIDDFGTGYSSLSYLTQLRVDALKIDRSFILTMMDQPESMTIISTIISLAHALRLRVIAEGVEFREQSKLLRLLQCDETQGYFFGKPVPWDQYFELGDVAAARK